MCLKLVDRFRYATLEDGKLGLGGYLYEHLDKKIPIIGVAKSEYRSSNAMKLLRGESLNPLFISAIGMDLNVAFEYIKSMHGNYRFPTLLKLLDTKTRDTIDV